MRRYEQMAKALVAGALLLSFTNALSAHHSMAGYDDTKAIYDNARSAYPFAGNGRRNGPVVALTLAF